MPARKISKSRKHSKGSSKRSRASKLRSRKSQRGGAYSYFYSSNGIDNWKEANEYQIDAIKELLQRGLTIYNYNRDGRIFTLEKLPKNKDNREPEAFKMNFRFERENGTFGYLKRTVSDEHGRRMRGNLN